MRFHVRNCVSEHERLHCPRGRFWRGAPRMLFGEDRGALPRMWRSRNYIEATSCDSGSWQRTVTLSRHRIYRHRRLHVQNGTANSGVCNSSLAAPRVSCPAAEIAGHLLSFDSSSRLTRMGTICLKLESSKTPWQVLVAKRAGNGLFRSEMVEASSLIAIKRGCLLNIPYDAFWTGTNCAVNISHKRNFVTNSLEGTNFYNFTSKTAE